MDRNVERGVGGEVKLSRPIQRIAAVSSARAAATSDSGSENFRSPRTQMPPVDVIKLVIINCL